MVLSREKTGTFYYICGADANHKSGGNQCESKNMDEDVSPDPVTYESRIGYRETGEMILLPETRHSRYRLSRISKRNRYIQRLRRRIHVFHVSFRNIKNRLDVAICTGTIQLSYRGRMGKSDTTIKS